MCIRDSDCRAGDERDRARQRTRFARQRAGVVRRDVRPETRGCVVCVRRRGERVLDREARWLIFRNNGGLELGGGFVPGGRAEAGKRHGAAAAANAHPLDHVEGVTRRVKYVRIPHDDSRPFEQLEAILAHDAYGDVLPDVLRPTLSLIHI